MACAGLRMSAEEFLALGETEQRLELVDGVVVVSPSPIPLHQRVAGLLFAQLLQAAEQMPDMQVYYETDVVLARRLVYCPDIVAYSPGRLQSVPARLDLPPDLVVEVLSPENRKKDLVTKREDYEKHGVGEYWIVEPDGVAVTVLARQGAQFVEQSIVGDVIVCRSIPGVRVDLARARRGIG